MLIREQLLIERARVGLYRPKSSTRIISSRAKLGPERRGLLARIERRVRDRATPQAREYMRGLARLRYTRRRPEAKYISVGVKPRTLMLKNIRL